MENKWTNNLGLKLISVIIAVFIWLIVVNEDDPITTRRFTGIPVQIQNEAYVEKNGQICMFEAGSETTTVTITGRRKLLRNLTSSDIIATADMRQAVSLETDPVMLPIAVSCRGIDQEQIKATPQNIAVKLEEKMTQDYLVYVNSSDSKAGKGYEIGMAVSNPEKIKITGPVSLMKKIDKVIAYVSVSGITSDITEEVDLKIIDKNQEEFSSSEMRYLRYDVSKVMVSLKLWKVQNDVKIVANYSGEPEQGFQVTKQTITPASVSVTGSDDALQILKNAGNVIEIPAEMINVTGCNDDLETKVDISELLPEETRLTTDTQSTVLVETNILPIGSKEYEISTKDIKIVNAPKGLAAVFETEKVELRIASEDGNTENTLQAKNINVKIDLKDMLEGSYDVPLIVTLPKGYKLVEKQSTKVTLSKIEETGSGVQK